MGCGIQPRCRTLGGVFVVLECLMPKGAQAIIILINSILLAPLTGGVSIAIGVIVLMMVLGDK